MISAVDLVELRPMAEPYVEPQYYTNDELELGFNTRCPLKRSVVCKLTRPEDVEPCICPRRICRFDNYADQFDQRRDAPGNSLGRTTMEAVRRAPGSPIPSGAASYLTSRMREPAFEPADLDRREGSN